MMKERADNPTGEDSADVSSSSIFWPTPEERCRILETFIRTFLPATPGRRKNVPNEIHYLCTTLSRIMLQNFGFRVGVDDLLPTLARLHYAVYNGETTWNYGQECLNSDAAPDMLALTPPEPVVGKNKYLHVNVNPRVVRTLRLTTIPLPPNTKGRKCEEVEQLNRRICALREQLQQGG